MDKYQHLAGLFLLASGFDECTRQGRNWWISPDLIAQFGLTVGRSFPDLPGPERFAVVDEMFDCLAEHLNSIEYRPSRNSRDRVTRWLHATPVPRVLDELFKMSELLDGQADR